MPGPWWFADGSERRLWQAFVGVAKRRVDGYYNNLLNPKSDTVNSKVVDTSHMNNTDDESEKRHIDTPEKWKGQIEKDLPRTFPGHPALDEDGRNALRRLLTAYARHNPSVGYCQVLVPLLWCRF
ncbi:TBC1 domain family member 10B-like [Iris pallida]|uniref:TBC1 domain family member 10B-like n=1 Tax=Iris pallida TaxID=29817 RepID=A0AAX6HK18_IRIPA|nr:TBC1 domain family member 10B-like [Iris pallida]